MLLFILTHKLLSGLIWLLIVCGVGLQIIMGIRLQRLLDEMDKMSTTKDPFLNKCRLCPEGTSPRTHVDHMMENYHICGCTPATLKALSGQAIMLSVVLSGVGVCVGIARGETIGSLLPYYVFCMIGLYAFFAISGAVNLRGRLEKIREKLYHYVSQRVQDQDKPKLQTENTAKGEATAKKETIVKEEMQEHDCTLELVELLDELLV